MKIVGVIPARMGSSRFPGKPLAPILGRPMIEHVYRRTEMCPSVNEVFVATCDEEIMDAVVRFGGKAIMTSSSHDRASDRVAEAARHLDADIIVMIQGDEPMVHPEMVEEAVFPMLAGDDRIICVNLAARIGSEKEFEDRNTIKVVSDLEGFALYMSREAIPTRRIAGFAGINVFKQVCIIPFTARGLKNFSELPPTPLEKAESIDMLRFLEHGLRVKMVETCFSTHAVDTPADLAFVQELLRSDSLTAEYLRK